jgi:hypothetical protein
MSYEPIQVMPMEEQSSNPVAQRTRAVRMSSAPIPVAVATEEQVEASTVWSDMERKLSKATISSSPAMSTSPLATRTKELTITDISIPTTDGTNEKLPVTSADL